LNCLTDEQLEMLVSQALKKAIAALEEKEAEKPSEGDELIPQLKAAQMLDVHHSTLWHWTRKGLIHPVKFGGRTMFRLSEINELKRGGKAYE